LNSNVWLAKATEETEMADIKVKSKYKESKFRTMKDSSTFSFRGF